MDLKRNIDLLKTSLETSLQEGRTFEVAARDAVKNIDWSGFERSDLLPLLKEDLCRQHYGPYNFGRFNLTLYWSPAYSIQLYFMDDIGTEIHAHNFRGYFYYLEGKVHQTRFIRKPGREILPRVFAEAFAPEKEEILYAGSGQLIDSDYLHQVLRLDERSSVLMIMDHTPRPSEEELLLPSGHRILGGGASDRFHRLLTYHERMPELSQEILRAMDPVDMLLYCFRNPSINATGIQGVRRLLIEELRKVLPIDEILRGFQDLEAKKFKLKALR